MTNKPDVIKTALRVKTSGGYCCSKCNTVYDHFHDCSVGKQESVLYKEIWNEAIEAAAIMADNRYGNYGMIAEDIRDLKK